MISCPVPRCLARRSRPWHAVARLCLEALEGRAMPSLTPWPALNNPLVESEANGTADRALDLGTLSALQRGEAVGTIGGAAGVADVDWYRFSLDRAAHVVLTTLNELAGTTLVSVLSLYNDDTDFVDLHNPVGKRLLVQKDAADDAQQDVRVSRNLAPGTYYVALSGSGNRDFHPFLDDSGLPGSTGDYGLMITVEDLGTEPATNGPVVLALDPEEDAVLNQAPFVVRVSLNENLDPSTLPMDPSTDDWVQLRRNPTRNFGDGNDVIVGWSSINFSASANELQIVPQRALQPGYYQLFLAGDAANRPVVLRDLDGQPLGANLNQPDGQDYLAQFEIAGVEGVAGAAPTANDVPDAAHDLGELANEQFLVVRGAIGDDPAYDPSLENPFLIDPSSAGPPPYLFSRGADVDLYAFRVPAGGSFVFTAEAFAGRIGSPLDPTLSLYRRASTGAPLTFVTANDSTLNRTRARDLSLPLFSDAALTVTLTPGDYFLAVSASGNMQEAWMEGYFDPNVSHSGREGYSLGSYALSVGLYQDATPPEVVATTPQADAILPGPPGEVRIRFSEAMNVYNLALQAFTETMESHVPAIWIEDATGQHWSPRLISYDAATNEAVFLMLDGLANGDFALHISGGQGVTDLAGNPLTGNDPSGDYVVHFQVNGPERPRNAQGQLRFLSLEPNDSFDQAQDLGVLFPRDTQEGAYVSRVVDDTLTDTVDCYRFTLLQSQSYTIYVRDHNLPAGTRVRLKDAAGNLVPIAPLFGDIGGTAMLEPGTYTLALDGWTPAEAAALTYNLYVGLIGVQDNPAPVATGALTAARFRLASNRPPDMPPLLPPPPLDMPPPPESPPSSQEPEVQRISVPPLETGALAPAQFELTARSATPSGTTSSPPNQDGSTSNAALATGSPTPSFGMNDSPRTAEPLPPAPELVLLVTIVSPTVTETVPPLPTTTLFIQPSRAPEAAVVPSLLSSLRDGPVGGVQETTSRDTNLPGYQFANAGPVVSWANDSPRLTLSAHTEYGGATPDRPSLNQALARPAPEMPGTPSSQQTLDLIFGALGLKPAGPLLMPNGLLQQYQQLRQLWNEAFESFFAPANTQQSTEEESMLAYADVAEVSEEAVVAVATSAPRQPSDDGLLGQALLAAGGALAVGHLHRLDKNRAEKRRRNEECVHAE